MRYSVVYDNLLKMARSADLARHDAEAFYAAWEQATMSDFGTFSVGCVIVYGNQIIGRGFNSSKTDPSQKLYNLRHRNFVPVDYSNKEHSLHAEMMALKSIPYTVAQKINWKKAKAYVFRIAPGLPMKQGVAAPCCACAHALADAGIRKVYFTTDYGFASSILSESGMLNGFTIDESSACYDGRCAGQREIGAA